MTINNPKMTGEELDAFLKRQAGVKHYAFQLEKGENGTPHFQLTINYDNARSFAAVKSVFTTAHIQKSKNGFKAWQYCTKKDTRIQGPWTFGPMPKPPTRSKTDTLAFNSACLEQGPEEMIPTGQLSFKDYIKVAQAVNLYKLHTAQPNPNKVLQNYWFTGPTGTGKSREARARFLDNHGVHYNKMMNKWWDGYRGQDVVILDDITPEYSMLLYHILIWTDHYDFNAEVKGGTVNIRPRIIIITSNYTIEEVFGKDDPVGNGFKNQDSLNALHRRLRVEKFGLSLKSHS